MAVDGTVGANYLLTRIGNTYASEDCVHAVVINLIRNCQGGDKSYRTAGCTELWNSYDKTGKYHHITKRMTLAQAKQDGLLIGDLPVIYDESTGTCEHIAYYMGGIGGYECIHSSASKGCVCGTTLKNGFTHVLRHRDITGVNGSQASSESEQANGEKGDYMDIIYYAKVTTAGGALNLRSEPRSGKNILCEIPFGTEIGVAEETNADWAKVQYGDTVGYAARAYLTKTGDGNTGNEDESEEVIQEDTSLFGGTWGVFIPCANKLSANTLAEYFAKSDVVKLSLGD